MVVDLPGTGDGDDDDDDGNYGADDDDGDDKGDEDDDEGGGGDEDDDAVLILLPNFILFSLFLDHPSSSTSFSSTSICSGSLIHSNTGQPACQLCFFLGLEGSCLAAQAGDWG